MISEEHVHKGTHLGQHISILHQFYTLIPYKTYQIRSNKHTVRLPFQNKLR